MTTTPLAVETVAMRKVFGSLVAASMPVLVGVLPLVSYKNAEFLHNEVPGMQIPEAIRDLTRGGVETAFEAVGEERVIAWLDARTHWPHWLRNAGAWFIGAVVCPLIDFFGRLGWKSALLILLFMASYRLTDFTMGSMANPFYIDKGYTLAQIATVVKVFGIATSMVGIVIAGIVIAKLGILRALVLGNLGGL